MAAKAGIQIVEGGGTDLTFNAEDIELIQEHLGRGPLARAYSTFVAEVRALFGDVETADSACPNQEWAGEVALRIRIARDKAGHWLATPEVLAPKLAGKGTSPVVDQPPAAKTIQEAQLSLFGAEPD